MSNTKEPPIVLDTFFEDAEKNVRMKQILTDLYKNTSFKDTVLEAVTPNIKSMQDGESKTAKVGNDIRTYKRVGDSLYYSTLTKVPNVNFTKLKVTDTDGTVKGELWYDDSENKLKVKTAVGVETITSS